MESEDVQPVAESEITDNDPISTDVPSKDEKEITKEKPVEESKESSNSEEINSTEKVTSESGETSNNEFQASENNDEIGETSNQVPNKDDKENTLENPANESKESSNSEESYSTTRTTSESNETSNNQLQSSENKDEIGKTGNQVPNKDDKENTSENPVDESKETINSEETLKCNEDISWTEESNVGNCETRNNEHQSFTNPNSNSKEKSNDEIGKSSSQEEIVENNSVDSENTVDAPETVQNDSVSKESEKVSDSHVENISTVASSDDKNVESSENKDVETSGSKDVEHSDVEMLDTSVSESVSSNKDKENEETDDDFDPSLLCPEVSMDVDETEVVTNNVDGRAPSPLLYEPLFSTLVDEMTGAEVMFDLTPEEEEIRRTTYGPSNPIKFCQIHCSACNIHLGSALDGQKNRFVHPLLKVLICKNCFHFYTSGEFEKDEDGSELYCRWCGQGGNVICCSKCEFVFCKKCIRNNFGQRKLKAITESDDWACFRCDQSQLKYLRALCAELFEYIRREFSQTTVDDTAALSKDYSRCCQNNNVKRKTSDKTSDGVPKKRKRRSSSADPDYNPVEEEVFEPPKQSKPIILQPAKLSLKTIPTTTTAPSMPSQFIYIPHTINSTIQFKSLASQLGQQLRYVRPVKGTPPRMAPPVVLRGIPSTGGIRFTTYTPMPRPPRLVNPLGFRPPPPLQPGTIRQPPPLLTRPTIRASTMRNVGPRKQQPFATKTKPQFNMEWYEKTVRAAARVNSNLSFTLTQLNRTQDNASSVKDLAILHNKLQELLSNSINSLIQIRKSLHTDFVAGVRSLNVTKLEKSQQQVVQQAPNDNDDDDDVIFVESGDTSQPVTTTTPTTTTTTTTTVTSTLAPPPLTQSYIKVRPMSALQNIPPECITLPDNSTVKMPPLNPLPAKNSTVKKTTYESLLISEILNGISKPSTQKTNDKPEPFVISNVTTVMEDNAVNQVNKSEVEKQVKDNKVVKNVEKVVNEKVDNVEKVNNVEKVDNEEKVDNVEKVVNVEKLDNVEKMENVEKVVKNKTQNANYVVKNIKYNVKTFPSPTIKRMQDIKVKIERNKEVESRIRKKFNIFNGK